MKLTEAVMPNNSRRRYASFLSLLSALCALALAMVTHVARADDIDAYSNPPGLTGAPNILFIIDNSANWSGTIGSAGQLDCKDANLDSDEKGTKMGAEKCALYTLFSQMTDEEFKEYNFAFMFFNESPYSSGYPRLAFGVSKDRIIAMILGLDRTGDAANNAATAESFYEAYLWFTSSNVHLGDKTVNKLDKDAFNPYPTKYNGPVVGCAKNHIIYLANGFPQDNNTKIAALLKSLDPSAQRFRIPTSLGVGNEDEANWADEFADFFNGRADLSSEFEGQQAIQVNTIAVTGAASDKNYPNYFKWVTQMGGGSFTEATSPDEVLEGVRSALNQIRASNSAFSSAALPASANTQGAFRNQVFIGMFRPDGNALPRWVGNLKQYQFKYDAIANTLELADALGNPAVSAVTGFINTDARSFWTQPSSFWINAALASNGKYSMSDAPDGPLVEKGGIGQWLRKTYAYQTGLQVTRPVYTCLNAAQCGGTDSSFVPVALASAGDAYKFSVANGALKSQLQSLVGSKDQLLINWVRGEENVVDNVSNVSNFEVAKDQLTSPPLKNIKLTPPISDDHKVRPSVHGDVLHSRPVALNYGDDDTDNTNDPVVVFYGANDGMLRAIDGRKDPSLGGGRELWAFVAPEHFDKLNRLRENDPEVLYPSTPDATVAKKRSYYFDGPIGAYQNKAENIVMIFATMRRGGNSVYAFDVTDPADPKLAWRVSPTRTGYGNLGQTWSTPRIAPVKDREPVLVMGGGYDPAEDDGSSLTMGTGVYVIDPLTGVRLGYLPTDYSVPSDVSLIDTDGDNLVDRGYVVDVRANVYRIDMEAADGTALPTADWKITKIAEFWHEDPSRRVFFAPDVVRTGKFIALMLGTGDREKPLETNTNDRFFIMKDRNVKKGQPASVTVLRDNDTAKVVEVGPDALKNDPEACYVKMTGIGEKVINQPVTFGGVTYFSSSRPSTGGKTCSTILSKAYQVPLVCQAPAVTELVGDGLPPSPVVGYVEVTGADGKDKVVPFVIGGPNTKKSAIEVGRPNLSIPGNRKRSYWFMQNRDR